MDRDLRQTPLYREIEERFHRIFAPAFGRISDAADPAPSPDGRYVAFTGGRLERLEGAPTTRICLADVETGTFDEITAGPNDDRFARWSPDGTRLAFLSDRVEKGHQQLYLLEREGLHEAISAPAVDGTVEYLAWSPDGSSILIGVAGPGADVSDVQGTTTTLDNPSDLPAWIPQVDSGVAENQWRRLWRYDLDTGTNRLASREGLNVWEAVWVGPQRLAAIVSREPGEGAWYGASLALIDVANGREEIVYSTVVICAGRRTLLPYKARTMCQEKGLSNATASCRARPAGQHARRSVSGLVREPAAVRPLRALSHRLDGVGQQEHGQHRALPAGKRR